LRRLITFDAIERVPEMFRRVHGEVRRANVSRFPYAVFYRIDPKSVVVLTVLHTAREPKLWPQPKKQRLLTAASRPTVTTAAHAGR
jgi:hypothetical protein